MSDGSRPLTYDQFAAEVRAFIRDFPELNRLISGEESSDRMVKYCIHLALDDWNTSPPLTSHAISSFPSRTILLHLTLIHLLTSVSILHVRNAFAYNDGGFSVQTDQQGREYQNLINLFRSQVEPKIRRVKVAMNISGAWGGGVGSEYGYINGWYGDV